MRTNPPVRWIDYDSGIYHITTNALRRNKEQRNFLAVGVGCTGKCRARAVSILGQTGIPSALCRRGRRGVGPMRIQHARPPIVRGVVRYDIFSWSCLSFFFVRIRRHICTLFSAAIHCRPRENGD